VVIPMHELLWLSCSAKRCCSTRTVLPTGGDIRRIATALDVVPESFLRAVPADPSDEAGAVLAPSWEPFRLALARRPLKGRPATCSFLLTLGDDVARCGLGSVRPLPCQAFPAVGTSGVVQVASSHGCTCRPWGLGDLDRHQSAALLRQEEEERRRDSVAIRAWNARAEGFGTEAGWSFTDLCRYLFAASAPHDNGKEGV
jgi:Fe-S-cluster containining protein